MRWVFLSLVCLNLLVMLWFWRDQAGSQDISPIKEDKSTGQSLVLLSELDKGSIHYKKERQSTGKVDVKRCYSIGPFKDNSDAKFLAIRAESLGFESEMRSLSTGGDIEHWVHVPPLANRQQSLRLLRELQSRDIDSYVITKGELAEGISLGLFRNGTSANNLAIKMQELGYNVVVKEVLRGEKEQWLEFPQVMELTEAMRRRILGEGQTMEWMLTDCSHSK